MSSNNSKSKCHAFTSSDNCCSVEYSYLLDLFAQVSAAILEAEAYVWMLVLIQELHSSP